MQLNQNGKKHNIGNIYDVLFHVLFFCTYMNMAHPQLMDKILVVQQGYYILLTIELIFALIYCSSNLNNIYNLFAVFKNAKVIVLLTFSYFCWDIINWIYAYDKSYIFSKYFFIIKMLVVAFLMILYLTRADDFEKRMKKLMLNYGCIALVLSLSSTICYYLSILTLQDFKISPTSDYNNFSITIIMGLICLVALIIDSKKNFYSKLICLFCISAICIPAVYLSASRRAIYTLYILLIVFGVVMLINLIKEKNTVKEYIFKAIAMLIISLMVLGIFKIQVKFFYEFNENLNVVGLSVTERLEEDKLLLSENSEADGNEMKGGIRHYIWDEAFNNIRTFNFKECIFGKGGSYSNDIYVNAYNSGNELSKFMSNSQEKILTLDPHNFILNDMLEGGAIKIAILLTIILSILSCIVRGFKKEPLFSLVLMLMSLSVILAVMVSAHFGIMWTRWSIIIIAMTIAWRGSKSWNS